MLRWDFGLLMGAHFLQALGFSSMLLLPLYLEHLGASRTEIGAVMATAAVSGLLARPLVGWSLDRVGRKPTLFTGTACLVSGVALVAAVDDLGPVVYVARLLVGVGTGALFTGYFTLASDLVPVSRRVEGLALFGVSGLAPLAVNPLVQELGVAAPGLRWVFPLIALLIAGSALFLWKVPEPESGPRLPLPLAKISRALAHRDLWSVWLATCVFSTLVAVFMAFATVTAAERGVERPALIWLAYAGGAIAVRVFGARLPERIGIANMIAPALGIYALASILVADGLFDRDFLFAGLLAGLGHGYGFPVLTGQVVERAPQALRGMALAAFTALWELTRLSLTPAFGWIGDLYGDPALFISAALLTAAGLAVWLGLEHTRPRRME